MAQDDKVYKLIDVVGTSSKSIDDAIRNATRKAGQTLHNLDWFTVQEVRGSIENGEVAQFQVSLRIGFRLD